jgi:hypothetical protein
MNKEEMNMFMPNCVSEYYREEQEKMEREYEKQHRLDDFYAECRVKVQEAMEKGYPMIAFGGYPQCQNCSQHSDEMAIDAMDDFAHIICYNKECKWHKIYEYIENNAHVISELIWKCKLISDEIDKVGFSTDDNKYIFHAIRSGWDVEIIMSDKEKQKHIDTWCCSWTRWDIRETVKLLLQRVMCEEDKVYSVKYEDSSGNSSIDVYVTEEEAEQAIENELNNVKEGMKDMDYDYGDFGRMTEIWIPNGDAYASWKRLWK